MTTPVLATERLMLRPFRTTDAPAVACLADDFAVASRTSALPHPYTLADALAFMADHDARRAQGTDFPFLIAWADTPVGVVGLHGGAPGSGALELGYWLGRRYWGRGFATEAARAATAFAFSVLDVRTLLAGHFADNPASGRVLTKLGFRYSGSVVLPCRARGCAVAGERMRLERDEGARAP